jgi:uroporphyrinogen decarboxylase
MSEMIEKRERRESERRSHKERLQACLAGETPDRPPVALWRHFPVDDQTPEGLAGATIDFQLTYDFDLVKVTPSSSFEIKDWGAEDEWRGTPEGTRDYTSRVVQHPQDWERLTVLDPKGGWLGQQLECLRVITSQLGPETPVIQTIFSPLSQAKNLAGGSRLILHLRQHPEAVRKGLETIAESTRRFIEAASETGIAGIFYAVQHAQYELLSADEYRQFGLEDDRSLCASAGNLWLNMLHLHGEQVMFDQFADFPVQIINWHDRDTPPSLNEGLERYSGAACGGLSRDRTMLLGTPEQVSAEAQDAIRSTGGRRFVLGTGCVIFTTVPRANIMAARKSVEPDER